VLVMRLGVLAGELPRAQATQEKVMALAIPAVTAAETSAAPVAVTAAGGVA
jgi:hypothetical protein